MVNVRIVEATDPDSIIDEYESEGAPRVGRNLGVELRQWSAPSSSGRGSKALAGGDA